MPDMDYDMCKAYCAYRSERLRREGERPFNYCDKHGKFCMDVSQCTINDSLKVGFQLRVDDEI